MEFIHEFTKRMTMSYHLVLNFRGSLILTVHKNISTKILTSSVRCAHAVNSQNYFNEIFKNRYLQKFRPSKILCYMVLKIKSKDIVKVAFSLLNLLFNNNNSRKIYRIPFVFSLIPRPHPAFHPLQYGKEVEDQ